MSNESEYTNLKKNRSIRRGLVTKTENQIKTLLQNFNMNNDDHEAKLEGLKNQYEDRLSSVKLLDQSIPNIAGPDNYENELIELEEYYDASFELLAKRSQKLNRIRNKPTIPLTTATSHHDTSINSNSTLPLGGLKLPKLKIQIFDGEIINWQTIWDQLESSIDSQENITDIDKFGYLRNLLCDSARETISGLTLTSENYKNAMQLLRDRFANPIMFKLVHIWNSYTT